jgi:SpoVK/Ycf46/Vps4 family AAA+-type ATPase
MCQQFRTYALMFLVFALCRFGQQNTRGVLLHGPPGTGKTSLAQLCAHDAGVKFFSINGPEIVTENYGESEKALQEVFDSAIQAAPAVVRYFAKRVCFRILTFCV